MAKDEEKKYPEGYEHVEQKIENTQARLQQLDQQIKNVPQNSKPAPGLRPPGFSQPRYFNRERAIGELEQQKTELKTGTFDQIEQEVRQADPKAARQVRDQAREELFPNPFKRMDVKERNRQHTQPKDIERSQDYMDSMFTTSKDSPDKKNEVVEEKKTAPTPTPSTPGLNYSVTVNFDTMSGKPSGPPTKQRDRDKDMDRD